jgi:hypothetical protein
MFRRPDTVGTLGGRWDLDRHERTHGPPHRVPALTYSLPPCVRQEVGLPDDGT